MSFSRRPTTSEATIPGARWLRADLHASLSGDPAAFLEAAIEAGVDVLGLVPEKGDADALWATIETWNEGQATDGRPFRDALFALFPGIELSLGAGTLLLLCDPEIGRAGYRDLVNALKRHGDDALGAQHVIAAHGDEAAANSTPWDALMLAIASAPAGLPVAATQLVHDALPADLGDRAGAGPFFHATGAAAEKPGQHVTYLQLATPRIESLRQAFLAADSRVRLALERGPEGALVPLARSPQAELHQRPWLRSLMVRGGASFFGGNDESGQPRETRFHFSPDLTCVIGGSMAGKSTLLDGLRICTEAPLPADEALRDEVQARGETLFAAGAPEITLDCPNKKEEGAVTPEHWPALFFTQNELSRLATDDEALEEILGRLSAAEAVGIASRRQKLAQLDEELSELAEEIEMLDDAVEHAEHDRQQAAAAQAQLETFSAPGLERLSQTRRAHQAWFDASEEVDALLVSAQLAVQQAEELHEPELDEISLAALRASGLDSERMPLRDRRKRASVQLRRSEKDLLIWQEEARRVEKALEKHGARLEEEVARQLSTQGLGPEQLERFRALSKQAARLPAEEGRRENLGAALARNEALFFERRNQRQLLQRLQGEAYERVFAALGHVLGGKLVVTRVESGRTQPLDAFIRGLAKGSITRFWNQLDDEERRTLASLVPAQRAASEPLEITWEHLRLAGMSEAVERSFRELMTRDRLRELAAIRCPDRVVVALKVGQGEPRPLGQLSVGQRAGVMLSLLLESEDSRPLVIDQPEDAMDKAFLVEHVLPALCRLRGRRQVILASHDANVVVNGDPAQVLELEADANQGRVAVAGAIDDPSVREAIVRTVDGGEAVFALRREKYGF